LKAEPLKDAARWIDYRRHWEHRVDRLDACLHELQPKGEAKKRGRRKSENRGPR
jgi:hypothetical protein